jgi:hypothetical protein
LGTFIPEIMQAEGGDFRLPSPATIGAAAPHASKRLTPIDRKMIFKKQIGPEGRPDADVAR